jgi:hypothetical protein
MKSTHSQGLPNSCGYQVTWDSRNQTTAQREWHQKDGVQTQLQIFSQMVISTFNFGGNDGQESEGKATKEPPWWQSVPQWVPRTQRLSAIC